MNRGGGPVDGFIEFLEGLSPSSSGDSRGNPAALAVLRRGLGKPPGVPPETCRYVVPYLPHGCDWRVESCYYLVASLFAHYPVKGGKDRGNLGATLARVAKSRKAEPSTQRRFLRLLNCEFTELDRHLRGAVSLARSARLPVDWRKLLEDLLQWESPKQAAIRPQSQVAHKDVRRAWAHAFWQNITEADTGSKGSPKEVDTRED